MISDLRYVDSSSLSGEMQTREILAQNNTPRPVIDWVMDLVRDHRNTCQAYEKELHQVHMDMNQ